MWARHCPQKEKSRKPLEPTISGVFIHSISHQHSLCPWEILWVNRSGSLFCFWIHKIYISSVRNAYWLFSTTQHIHIYIPFGMIKIIYKFRSEWLRLLVMFIFERCIPIARAKTNCRHPFPKELFAGSKSYTRFSSIWRFAHDLSPPHPMFNDRIANKL